MKHTFIALTIYCLLLSSCKPSKTANKSFDGSSSSQSKYPYSPSRTLKNDLIDTKLEVSFDWQKQYLYGKATLTLKPYFYPQNTLELDAKGFDIESIKLGGNDLKYVYDKKRLTITLDKTYTREQTYSLEIKYTAKPNELPKGGNAAINSDKGLFFINADGKDSLKPQQIWTQGEIESSSCWFPTIDTPNEKMTQSIFITVEPKYKTLSNGKLEYSINNPDGTRTDFWKHDKPHAPYLVMMAVGDFALVKDAMAPSKKYDWNGFEVNYYVEPKYEPHAKAIFGRTPEMIEFFSNLLDYKYPWDKYSQIIVRDYVSGAMENTSATVLMDAVQCTSREMIDKNWDNIIAHELFHHWFGDLVTAESWPNLPLNESFANYSEYLWQEYKYGVDAADHHGLDELGGYLSESSSKLEPIIRYHLKDYEDMFDAHSYNKGGRILHMLRKYVGDEAFFKSLNLYLKTKEYKAAEVHDLRLAFEEVTGEDLNWFFNQWFMRPGHVLLKVEQAYENGKVILKLEQTQDSTKMPTYRLPMKVAIWVDGQKTSYPIEMNKDKQRFEFQVTGQPNLVIVDEEAQLLGLIEHEKTIKEFAFQYENAKPYLHRAVALDNLFQAVDSAATLREMRKALDDPLFDIRSTGIRFFDLFEKLATDETKAKIATMAENDPKGAVRAEALTFLSKEKEDYSALIQKALNDSSYVVQAAGLKIFLASKATDTEKQSKLVLFENSENIKILSALAEYYSENKVLEKNTWFIKNVTRFAGEDLFEMLDKWGRYLFVCNEAEKKQSITILEKIARENPVDWIRFGAFKALSKLPETKELRNDIAKNETSERLKSAYKRFN